MSWHWPPVKTAGTPPASTPSPRRRRRRARGSKKSFRQKIALIQESDRAPFGVHDGKVVAAVPAQDLRRVPDLGFRPHDMRAHGHDALHFLLKDERLLRREPAEIAVRKITRQTP